MAMIELKDVTKKYKNITAIDHLSMSVEKGSILGFLGQNGAGKTTTLRLLTGLTKADSGEIIVCGEKVTFGKLSTNKHIGYLPDVPEFYGYMKPMEYLALCGRLYNLSKEQIDSESKRLLELVGLAGVNRRIKGLSRGMKQRLGIAQALIHSPQLLLLDEPTSALDPVGRREVLDIIASLRGKVTVMFSTHILTDAQSICDTIGVLEKGKLAFWGSMDEIRSNYSTQNIRIKIVQKERLEELSHKLKQLPDVTAVRLSDAETLSVSTKAVNGIYKCICPLLTEMELHLKGFECEQSTLEDVFMEVIKK